jgi:hypothetical protein
MAVVFEPGQVKVFGRALHSFACVGRPDHPIGPSQESAAQDERRRSRVA